MRLSEEIYDAWHRGMVDSAIVRTLLSQGVQQQDTITRTHSELDFYNQAAIKPFLQSSAPRRCTLQLLRWMASTSK
jgi:GDP-L-fucose synthase